MASSTSTPDGGALLEFVAAHTAQSGPSGSPHGTAPGTRPCHVFFMQTSSRPCNSRQDCALTCRWLHKYKVRTDKAIDLRYNFMVGGDGRVYEARGFSTQPLLPRKWSHFQSKAILFGIIGKFYTQLEFPPNLISTALRVVKYGIKNELFEPFYDVHYIPRLASSVVFPA